MSYQPFEVVCPNCEKATIIGADDSSGPFTELWGECDGCGAELIQHVTWWYEYEPTDDVKVKT